MVSKICFVSIDVEHDLGEKERRFFGIENLNKILNIFQKYHIPATLFVTGEVLERFGNSVKEWSRNYEIASHSFSHCFWNALNSESRRKELENFTALYRGIFQKSPCGFRAPSHLIDEEGIELLEEIGFLYDSSIVPHYPFFKKYRGFRGNAPLLPYFPSKENCRTKGSMKILEIPVSGQFFGIPLAGAWIGRLPRWFYQIFFAIYSPKFLAVHMHSWDILDFPGRKSSPEQFLKNLDNILRLLKNKSYQFLNGEQIYQNYR